MQEFETIKEFFKAVNNHEGELFISKNKAFDKNKKLIYSVKIK